MSYIANHFHYCKTISSIFIITYIFCIFAVNSHVAESSVQSDTVHRTENMSKPSRDSKNRNNVRPPPSRRNEPNQPKEALVNGTAA